MTVPAATVFRGPDVDGATRIDRVAPSDSAHTVTLR